MAIKPAFAITGKAGIVFLTEVIKYMLQRYFYIVIIICVLLWLIGFFLLKLGDFTHLLLVAAIILLAVKLYSEEHFQE